MTWCTYSEKSSDPASVLRPGCFSSAESCHRTRRPDVSALSHTSLSSPGHELRTLQPPAAPPETASTWQQTLYDVLLLLGRSVEKEGRGLGCDLRGEPEEAYIVTVWLPKKNAKAADFQKRCAQPWWRTSMSWSGARHWSEGLKLSLR